MILLTDEVPVKFKWPASVVHVYEGQKHQSWQHCPAFSKRPTLGRRRCVKLCSCAVDILSSSTCTGAGSLAFLLQFYNLFFSTANKRLAHHKPQTVCGTAQEKKMEG
jgi:hypothetical protein